MHEITEYTIAVNGKIDPHWPVAPDHDQAVEDRLEWLELSPEDVVTIHHRRVRVYDWALTTPGHKRQTGERADMTWVDPYAR